MARFAAINTARSTAAVAISLLNLPIFLSFPPIMTFIFLPFTVTAVLGNALPFFSSLAVFFFRPKNDAAPAEFFFFEVITPSAVFSLLFPAPLPFCSSAFCALPAFTALFTSLLLTTLFFAASVLTPPFFSPSVWPSVLCTVSFCFA